MKLLKNRLLVIGYHKVASYAYWLLVILPTLWAFRHIIFGRLPTWGDAPFFYPEGLKELFAEPLTWVTRNVSFGGINQVLWLSPLMFLMGALHKLFGLGSDTLIRILFYFPSLVLTAIGPYFLARYLKLSKPVLFFAPLLYLLNSYFLLLVDGGQIGIALAYGMFPWVIFFGKKLLDKPDLNNLFVFLASAFVLTTVDPRISLIVFVTLFFWQIFENLKRVWLLILTGILLIPLNFYWIYPLIKLGSGGSVAAVADLQLSSLLNSLTLFAPHWPGNIFGKVIPPPFYFALIPFLVFGCLLFKPRPKSVLIFAFLFLFFAFISKGAAPPLGGWYGFLVNKIPLGTAFRDSTKFFIPLVLFGGILIGQTIAGFKGRILHLIFYILLLFLVYPALTGKMNFNLSSGKANADLEVIYANLKNEDPFSRTAWVPEKHPLAYEASYAPAVNARDLVKLAPLADLNASEDVFNFLNNPAFADWFKIFGIKYLIFSGDSRNLNPSESEVKSWQTILDLVENTPSLKKPQWGISIPAYGISDPLPQFYSLKSLIAVVGPPLETTAPAIYFEDGKLNPAILNGKDKDSLKIYFNGKEEIDLTMSLLQEYFVSPAENIACDWAVYPSTDYLKTKYELLIRGFKYRDLDYGRGVAFSTKAGEKIVFRFEVPADGRYLIAARKASFDKQNLFWEIEGMDLKKGNFSFEAENKSDFEVLNTVALIPQENFKKAQESSAVFIEHFGTINAPGGLDWQKAEVQKEGTLKYTLENNREGYWIILNENYHPLWNLKKGIEYFKPVPVYSAVNGFYIEPDWGDLHIEFRGQEYFRWGVWVSVLSILALSVYFLYEKADRSNTGN